jgi:hypothetical protein
MVETFCRSLDHKGNTMIWRIQSVLLMLAARRSAPAPVIDLTFARDL